MNKALFLSVIAHQTARLAAALGPAKEDQNPLTSEELAIREAFEAISCGGARADYRRTVERQWKEKGKKLNPMVFESREDEDEVSLNEFPLAAFVPLRNPNAHNYKIGEVAVLLQNRDAYSLAAESVGNYMTERKSALRIATLEEIEATLDHAKNILHASRLKFSDYDLFDAEDTVENVLAIVEKL